jgi:type I restriction enzyme S subunit
MAGEIETLDLIGDLPSNWKIARFGDVLEGGTRNGIYKAKEFHGSGAKVVNMGELFANPRLRDVPMKRVQLSDAELEKSCLNAGDLLFARRSLVAEGAGKCIVVAEVKEPTTFESSIIRARPNPKAADSLFLYYLFNSPYGAYVLLTIRRQVAVSGITGTDLVELPIPLPPLAEQKAIAAVLGALDDKIELNRRMNATLEAMARALFQSWFVDFDPVRAKLDGRSPDALDPATAALFPASFQESSLGPIPHGWRAAHLGEIATVGSGKRPEGRCDVLSPECNIPLYGGGGRMGYVPSDLYDKPILFTGRVGTLGLIFRTAEPSWPSDNTLIVEPQPGLFDFTYFVLKGFDLITLNRGSTQPLLTQTDLKRQTLVLPTKDVVKAFADVSEPIFRQMVSNERESRTLATLRDTLLPKLLSGELSTNARPQNSNA